MIRHKMCIIIQMNGQFSHLMRLQRVELYHNCEERSLSGGKLRRLTQRNAVKYCRIPFSAPQFFIPGQKTWLFRRLSRSNRESVQSLYINLQIRIWIYRVSRVSITIGREIATDGHRSIVISFITALFLLPSLHSFPFSHGAHPHRQWKRLRHDDVISRGHAPLQRYPITPNHWMRSKG